MTQCVNNHLGNQQPTSQFFVYADTKPAMMLDAETEHIVSFWFVIIWEMSLKVLTICM